MFWSEGEFEPAPEFATVRPLFDRGRQLLEADEIDAWGAAWDEPNAGLVLDRWMVESRSPSSCCMSTGGRHPGDTEEADA